MTDEMTPLEKLLNDRLRQTKIQVEEIEKQLPDIEKDYNAKMQELEKCTDKTRLGILRTFLKERRLYLKQLNETRDGLVKQIRLIVRTIDQQPHLEEQVTEYDLN